MNDFRHYVNVRTAQQSDVDTLMALITRMSEYERLPLTIDRHVLLADGFGLNPRFHAAIVEVDSHPAGYALYHDCYSSFEGRGMFLEDLFVDARFRGTGVGDALLTHVSQLAVDEGCFGIMFNVLVWNDPALKFFARAGAITLDDRKTLCLALSTLKNERLR